MLLKWLILGLVVYFIYRNIVAQPRIDKSRRQNPQQIRNEPDAKDEDGEFIDYEEVD